MLTHGFVTGELGIAWLSILIKCYSTYKLLNANGKSSKHK